MATFGFSISKPRSIEPNDHQVAQLHRLEEREPSFRRCFSCGACSATCSAAQFTRFNIRKIHHLYRWGQYAALEQELQQCMLCGKCTLVCPRGVNLRHLIISMKVLLNERNHPNKL